MVVAKNILTIIALAGFLGVDINGNTIHSGINIIGIVLLIL